MATPAWRLRPMLILCFQNNLRGGLYHNTDGLHSRKGGHRSLSTQGYAIGPDSTLHPVDELEQLRRIHRGLHRVAGGGGDPGEGMVVLPDDIPFLLRPGRG